jgi:hypothetical protein
MKKIEVPKMPTKYQKTEISPVMINDNLGPTNADIRILSKYFNKKKHVDINENLHITNNGKKKTHFVGASSIYIGQEPSIKQKPRVELDFGAAKNEGMMENLLISAES